MKYILFSLPVFSFYLESYHYKQIRSLHIASRRCFWILAHIQASIQECTELPSAAVPYISALTHGGWSKSIVLALDKTSPWTFYKQIASVLQRKGNRKLAFSI